MGLAAATASLLIAAASAAAAPDVDLPPAPPAATSPGAAPAPPAPAAAAAAPAARPARAATVRVRLSVGATGPAVRDLQRELRRRGVKVAVDGAFGPATRRAVRRMQKRFRMRRTGVADTRLLRRLGLQTRAAASAPAAPIVPATSGRLQVFPVAGENQYSDDFGAARHQGRHEGVDIVADRNTPVVAVVDAVVDRVSRTEDGLGGLYVWLERSDGTEYYYAHLESVAPGIEAGVRVTAGQVIGAVGNSGDARYGATHLHFEIRPGGTPADPYPDLVAVDPSRAAAAAQAGRSR